MEIFNLIDQAIAQRKSWFKEDHSTAFRLFNGFIEGFPDLAIDIYGNTLLLFNFANPPTSIQDIVETIWKNLCQELPWVQAVVIKNRYSKESNERRGSVIHGQQVNRRVREEQTWYALDLLQSNDASLYLDTRNLRHWITQHAKGLRVLNCFAYTGSLGVAAQAGGAAQVIQLDRNRAALNLAKDSYSLNGFPIIKSDFVKEDFFTWTSRMRQVSQRFDMVLLDPPFFSVTPAGRVDLNQEYSRLINKVRPLVEAGGFLVAVNNALFVSGAQYVSLLEELCRDGYLAIEEFIPVPADFSGFVETRQGNFPTDPNPFNHPTKIAVLKVIKIKN